MVLKELQEAVRSVRQTPVLWIPGVVAGLLGAMLWILLNISGTFITSRLVIISGLVMVLFVAGTFGLIRNNETNAGTMLREGVHYYFRVLLPWLVILFVLLLVFALITIFTILSTGGSADYGVMGLLTVFVMIPTLFLTFFCDTAAAFEDLRIFASIRRSIGIVSDHARDVLGFFVICCVLSFIDLFVFALVWEGLLFDKLEPLSHYNESQLAAITPQQLVSLIGPDGMWVTAAIIFFGVVFLVPLLLAYKACFYRSLTGSPAVNIRQMTGEFDSKGRWYKY
ncbi:MAG: hypothetical protein ABSG28_10955 [Methanoregula sp.]|uniref:DUF7847 domain-containing protein n=1 Tax=Methanoregula sp. TaxID=2052170 RepID=UPI003C1C5358